MVDDMIRLTERYGLPTTIANNNDFVEVEMYRIFLPEFSTSLSLSLFAVITVVGFITANWQMSLLIVASVILVDFYLVSLIYFWGMTLNMFTGINMVISMGLAVDYSAHIAHKFMLLEPKDPVVARNAKKLRHYKAQNAISKIGASVFHAAFSSLLALSVLGWSKSYHFQVGFRIWVGIISFGFFTGFFLLPVVLSWVGPVVV